MRSPVYIHSVCRFLSTNDKENDFITCISRIIIMTSKTEETFNLLKEAGETQLGNENVTLKGIIRSNE